MRDQARINAIADTLKREGHFIVSGDGLYREGSGDSGMYVNISSELSGLPDNTMGGIGEFPVYLPHPDERVSAELLAGARDFSEAVEVFRDRERREREARWEAEEEAQEREAERKAFTQAYETGKRAKIRSYLVGCNERDEDCSTDVVTVWAMPDDTTKTTRIHTW